MTRADMDKLKIGDVIKYRVYSQKEEDYVEVDAIVERVIVCSDGGTFAHGGRHSVWIQYENDGRVIKDVADNELVVS